ITGKLQIVSGVVDLLPVIEAAVDSVRPALETKGIEIEISIEARACFVEGDANRLQQVFWNLLSNAVKFTPEGGRVKVSVHQRDSRVQITVSDTGIGIAPEFLPYIFDRFRQADGSTTRTHGGLGLGLAIVRHLVELHQGTVEVQSHGEKQGTIFTVTLPIVPVETAHR